MNNNSTSSTTNTVVTSTISHTNKKKNIYNFNGTNFEVDNRYTIHKPIGYGAYGFVCSALDTKSNEKVAIKKIPKVFQDLVDGKRILREIKLLRHLNHENVISIKDIMRPTVRDTFEDVYIVSELMDTDLHQVIRSKQALTEEHYQYFIYQLCRGLKYIHSAQVLHRDLKPSNLLVNGNCDLKICDFGLARGFNPNDCLQELTEYVVTRWYRAPELLLMCQEYTKAIDMWSVGCILAELINRKPLFPGRDYIHQLNLITDVLGTPLDKDKAHVKHEEAAKFIRQMPKKKNIPFSKLFPTASKEAIDFLEKLLVFNPVKRLTAEEALAHPFLAALHDPNDEPVATKMFHFEFDSIGMKEPELREQLWQEALAFHPLEEDSEDNSILSQAQQATVISNNASSRLSTGRVSSASSTSSSSSVPSSQQAKPPTTASQQVQSSNTMQHTRERSLSDPKVK